MSDVSCSWCTPSIEFFQNNLLFTILTIYFFQNGKSSISENDLQSFKNNVQKWIPNLSQVFCIIKNFDILEELFVKFIQKKIEFERV